MGLTEREFLDRCKEELCHPAAAQKWQGLSLKETVLSAGWTSELEFLREAVCIMWGGLRSPADPFWF